MRKEFTRAQMPRKNLKVFRSREFRVGGKETMLALVKAHRDTRYERGKFLTSGLFDSPYPRLPASAT